MSISSMMLNSRAHDRRALFPCARSFRAPPAFPPPGPPLSGSRSRAPRAAFRAGGRASDRLDQTDRGEEELLDAVGARG